jgi:hypothetical protein
MSAAVFVHVGSLSLVSADIRIDGTRLLIVAQSRWGGAIACGTECAI